MDRSRRLLAALLLMTPLAASGQVAQKSFRVRLYAPHLEPGLEGRSWTPGDEMIHGAVERISPAEGRMTAAMWLQKALVTFRTAPDGGTLADWSVELGERGPDLWRWRHGYLKRGGEYLWNTLGDHPEPLAPALASAYDEFLLGAWRLWAGRRLKTLLGGASPARFADIDAGASHAEIEKDFTLRFDRKGLVGTSFGEFYIRIWHIPVRVGFAVKAAQPGPYNRWILQLARPLEIRFDGGKQEEWRRRHGYSRDRAGAYAWDADFPEPRPAIAAHGRRFDELMRRGVEYWADAAVHQILDRLDLELKKELGLPPGAAAAFAEGPALEELRQAGTAWPR